MLHNNYLRFKTSVSFKKNNVRFVYWYEGEMLKEKREFSGKGIKEAVSRFRV